MAKKTKTNVEWFPHPVHHGRKMTALERRFGNDGYAVWFKLLEELGGAENHFMLLSDPYQIDLMADRCLVAPDRLGEIVTTLASWGEFDAELWEVYSAIYSQKLTNSVSCLYRKRSNTTPTREYIIALITGQPERQVAEKTDDGAIPNVNDYADIYAHHPILVAQAITGETETTNPRAVNAWRKYLRHLSVESHEMGCRMFRDVLVGVWGDTKAGEINNPAAILTKKLKELTQ